MEVGMICEPVKPKEQKSINLKKELEEKEDIINDLERELEMYKEKYKEKCAEVEVLMRELREKE